MRTLKRHEGYLQIDHRESPGLTEAEALAVGLPPALFAKGTMVERAIVKCSGCERGVVLNPDRTRPRNYAPEHGHYICDDCALVRKLSGGKIKSFRQVADETLEIAEKAAQRGRGIILVGGSK